MTRIVRRHWRRHDVRVTTIHPQYGELDRGRIQPAEDAEGGGAFMVWQITDLDHTLFDLLIAGDYLTAEEVLLDATAWADELDPDYPDPIGD